MAGFFVRLVVIACTLLLAACVSGPPRAAGEQIVILIGVDGLRPASLAEWPDAAPTLNALAARGVRAEGLIPVMPSKTFPNFYAIATGLHPDRHGITSNSPYSRARGEVMARADHGRSEWWGGEPIWVTAERQGATAAAMFWLGSEAEIAGVRPTFWSPYDHGKPFAERTQQVLAWLALPETQRPRFITVYFHAVDSAGHSFGPRSPEEREAMSVVDAEIAALIAGVRRLGFEDRVNFIVVSDHGMSEVGESQIVYLDDYADMEGVFIPEFHGPDGAGYGVLVHLYTERAREVRDALAGAHANLRVYLRDEIPARWRLNHPDRTGDLIAVADPGWLVFLRGVEPKYSSPSRGMHGYDRHHPESLGTFIAAGPRFAEGAVVPTFENVEIYGLIADILGLDAAETDGDLRRVRRLLKQ
jgi:predicted AlkP superfamily pyrophosphatase or phosphodiesterase